MSRRNKHLSNGYSRRKKIIQHSPKIREYQLYALQLDGGFYYVGMTSYKDATIRLQQHIDGAGAKWTKLHKPLKIIETRSLGVCTESSAAEAETLMTKEYMSIYGMYKVRGGSLCYVNNNMLALHFNDPIGMKRKSRHRIKQEIEIQEEIGRGLRWVMD